MFAESADAYTRVLDLTSPTEKSRWAIYYFRGVDYERAKIGTRPSPICKKPSSSTPNSRWC